MSSSAWYSGKMMQPWFYVPVQPSLILAASVLCSASAFAQTLTEDYTISNPPTVVWTENLGTAACAEGEFAVISAVNDSRLHTPSAGVVYIVDVNSGTHLYRLAQQDAEATDAFGDALDMADGFIVVGSPGDSDDGFHSGSAYLYHALSGAMIRKYTPGDGKAGKRFGSAVAVDNGIVAIGADADNDNGSHAGAVYLSQMATATPIAKLTGSPAVAGAHFGGSVDLFGDVLVVGAPSDIDPSGIPCGAAYIYSLSNLNAPIKVTPHDAAEGDFFGRSVATDGEFVVVGSPRDDTLGMNSGSIYVYNAATGAFVIKLKANESFINGAFGDDLSMDGRVLAVSANAYDGASQDSGAVFLFDTRSWAQIAKLQSAPTANTIYEFGYCVAVSGPRVLVGARRAYLDSAEIGMGYVFTAPDLACLADTNGDGSVTPADFSAWVAAFNAMAPQCDQNGDGQCTPADFSAWVANYNAGC